MNNKLYVIVRHDEADNCVRAYYVVDNETEAQKIVKHLNETDGCSIVLEDDGSMANICDDDAIWYDYDEVKAVKDYNDFEEQERNKSW